LHLSSVYASYERTDGAPPYDPKMIGLDPVRRTGCLC
jgi:hypothetical protein